MPPSASGYSARFADSKCEPSSITATAVTAYVSKRSAAMPGAVADVVADVVRDHGRVARVVLGDAGLDLPDEVGADVGGLGVDAAAEAREDRDERAAEREPDEVVDRGVLRVVRASR